MRYQGWQSDSALAVAIGEVLMREQLHWRALAQRADASDRERQRIFFSVERVTHPSSGTKPARIEFDMKLNSQMDASLPRDGA